MLNPVGHRVIVKPDPIQEKTKGGIILAHQDERLEKAGQQFGLLVAAGDQAWKAFGKDHDGEPWAEPGDYVVYSRYAGKFVNDPFTEDEYVVLNDDDIVMIAKEGENPIFEHPMGYEYQKSIDEE